MQALSFVVHIPLVCFGIAFPALVLFVEWLYLRTGDELYRMLARRWAKVSKLVLLASTPLAEGHQDYLLQAKQMQALSFVVRIPLVCFGIAFPALVLFVEWLYLRTGDELYRTLARRWTKVMAALFAAGVVTGTILSFEM